MFSQLLWTGCVVMSFRVPKVQTLASHYINEPYQQKWHSYDYQFFLKFNCGQKTNNKGNNNNDDNCYYHFYYYIKHEKRSHQNLKKIVTEYDRLSAPEHFSIGTVQFLSQKEYPICSGRCRSTSDSVYFARRLAQVVQCLVCNTLESSRVKHWRIKRRGYSCISYNFIMTKRLQNTVVLTIFLQIIRRYTTIYLRTNRQTVNCPDFRS